MKFAAGVLLAGAAVLSTYAQQIVVPNAYADQPAEYQVAGGAGGRLQQIYSSTEFGAASGAAFQISGIAWRPGSALYPGTYTWTIPDFEVYAFTTSTPVNGLSPIFADNYANSTDRTLVYAGPITFTTTLPADGSLYPFDLVIPFQAPFTYNPAAGNLVIEVVGYTFYDNLWDRQVDLVAQSDVVSYVWGSSAYPDGTINGFSGAGLVTQFLTDLVPAPVPPVTPATLTVSPGSVTGGGSATATVTFSAAAPAGGLTVALSSSSPAATVPASIQLPEGVATASFSISTKSVTATTTAIITASLNGGTASSTLTVVPPPVTTTPTLKEVSVSPKTITASSYDIQGEVILNGYAPAGGCTVNLSSSSPTALSVPASVTIPAGGQKGAFRLTRGTVKQSKTVQITATLGKSKKSFSVTVLP